MTAAHSASARKLEARETQDRAHRLESLKKLTDSVDVDAMLNDPVRQKAGILAARPHTFSSKVRR